MRGSYPPSTFLARMIIFPLPVGWVRISGGVGKDADKDEHEDEGVGAVETSNNGDVKGV